MKWSKISGYPTYMVSESGNIRNLITKTILKPKQRFDGYLEVALSNNGKVVSKKIHRLVAETFLPKPSGGGNYVVGHKNNKRTDNRVSNLVWMTQSDNNKSENQDDEKNEYQNDSKTRTFSSKSFKK